MTDHPTSEPRGAGRNPTEPPERAGSPSIERYFGHRERRGHSTKFGSTGTMGYIVPTRHTTNPDNRTGFQWYPGLGSVILPPDFGFGGGRP